MKIKFSLLLFIAIAATALAQSDEDIFNLPHNLIIRPNFSTWATTHCPNQRIGAYELKENYIFTFTLRYDAVPQDNYLPTVKLGPFGNKGENPNDYLEFSRDGLMHIYNKDPFYPQTVDVWRAIVKRNLLGNLVIIHTNFTNCNIPLIQPFLLTTEQNPGPRGLSFKRNGKRVVPTTDGEMTLQQ